jgi:glucan biosynthesis protein
MNRDEIIDNLIAIWDPDEVQAATTHPGFDDFVKAMSDRRYGPTQLSLAWRGFLAGWIAGVDKTMTLLAERVDRARQ